MKCKVVIGTLWVAGKKYQRGDVVDIKDPAQFGVKIEPVVETKSEFEPPKPTRKRRAVKSED